MDKFIGLNVKICHRSGSRSVIEFELDAKEQYKIPLSDLIPEKEKSPKRKFRLQASKEENKRYSQIVQLDQKYLFA